MPIGGKRADEEGNMSMSEMNPATKRRWTVVMMAAMATAAAVVNPPYDLDPYLVDSVSRIGEHWLQGGLDYPRVHRRFATYTILGRQSLLAGDRAVVPSGREENNNYFKVKVEMK